MPTYLIQDNDLPWVCSDRNAVLIEAKTPEEAIIKSLRAMPDEKQPVAGTFKIAQVICGGIGTVRRREDGDYTLQGEVDLVSFKDYLIDGGVNRELAAEISHLVGMRNRNSK